MSTITIGPFELTPEQANALVGLTEGMVLLYPQVRADVGEPQATHVLQGLQCLQRALGKAGVRVPHIEEEG